MTVLRSSLLGSRHRCRWSRPDTEPSYSNNTSAGTATASYTFAGDDNHTGSSDSKDFTIEKASSTTTVSCAAGPFTFDGTSQTPCTVHVTGAGGLDLTPAASYSNNVAAGTATASYTFAGDANHTGSSDSKHFTIDKASSTTVVTCPANVTYNGSAQTPCSVAVTGAGSLSLAPDAAYTNNANAGTATASYTYGGDANHTSSSDSKNFTIDKAASHTVVTCPDSLIYDGSARTPCSVAVTGAGGLSLTPAPNYGHNTDAGTATASYTYAGDANHDGSSDSKDFTIQKAASHTVVTCPASLIYDGSARTPCTVAVTGAGGLSLTPAASYSHSTDAGTATASYTYAGDANHDGSSDSKDFTINKRNVTALISAADKTYTRPTWPRLPCVRSRRRVVTTGLFRRTWWAARAQTLTLVTRTPLTASWLPRTCTLTGAAQGNYQLTSPTASTTARISIRDVTCLHQRVREGVRRYGWGDNRHLLAGRRAATMGQLPATPWVAQVRTVTSTTRTQPTASRSPVKSPYRDGSRQLPPHRCHRCHDCQHHEGTARPEGDGQDDVDQWAGAHA